MALFISFEGGEGSGKSTQAKRLARVLTEMGIPNVLLHEPGSTNLGSDIRRLIKGLPARRLPRRRQRAREKISDGAELFLFAAARAELVVKVISKELETPRLIIIADRYADSTVAYQSYGRGLDREFVDSTNAFATQGLMPSRTFLLDCPPEEGLRRVGSVQTSFFDVSSRGRMDEEGTRRFESEPKSFHERVRQGYLALAESDPDRWVVVDGTRNEDAVFEAIWNSIQELDGFRSLKSPQGPGESASDDPLRATLIQPPTDQS